MHRSKKEITEEQQAEIKEVFQLFDLDKDSCLSAAESRFALKSLGVELKTHQLIELLKKNGYTDPKVSYAQFFQITKKLLLDRDPLDEVRRAFQLFDEEGKGTISIKNLRQIANELGEQVDDEELHAMIEEFDADEDGEINEQEFIHLMLEAM